MGNYDLNPFPYPMIQYEELWEKPLQLEGFEYDWKCKVPTYERLYRHNTLASIRQNRLCKHPCAPKDSLDISLVAVYDHYKDSFLPKEYCFIQPETVGFPSYRLLRNRRFIPEKRTIKKAMADYAEESLSQLPGTKFYGVRIGGISEKRSPFSVKLGITSSNSSASSGGYSRKVDGTFYSS